MPAKRGTPTNIDQLSPNLSALFAAVGSTTNEPGPTCHALLRICAAVSWLPTAIFEDWRRAEADLKRLAAGFVAPTSTKGLGLPARLRALFSDVPAPDRAIEQLRAVLIVTAYHSDISNSSVLDAFAKLILNLAVNRDHPARSAISALRQCQELKDAQDQLYKVLRDIPDDKRLHQLAYQLNRIWTGESFVRHFKEPDARRVKPSQRPSAGEQSIRVTRVAYPLPFEKGLDPTTIETEVSVRTGTGVADDGSDAFVNYAELALRRANQFLVIGHIDALTDIEANYLAGTLLNLVAAQPGTPESGQLIALLLSLALGISTEKLANVRVGTGGGQKAELVLDIQAGLFWRPLTLHPAIEQASLPPEAWICVPLPPALLEALRHGPYVSSGLPAVASADIRSIFGRHQIELATAQPARIWHWAATQIQSVHCDVAATMAIAGDTFARSPAPLFYFKPKLQDLQLIYVRSIWPAFDGDPLTFRSSSQQRVGFAELVEERIARRSCKEIADKARLVVPRTDALGELANVHNRTMDATATRFCVNSLHRPTNALFKIRLGDISLSLGAAIVGDKRVDASHYLRFSALSRGCTDQMAAMVDHLRALTLRNDLPPSTRDYVLKVLAGTKPLFFHLSPQGNVVGLRIGSWHAGLPDRWKSLKPNWYRTFVATALRDAGANGDAIAIQLGHLEAAGFPFDDTSPLSFASFAKYLRPYLDEIDSKLDLPCVRGLARSPSSAASSHRISIGDWGRRLDKNQRWMSRVVTHFSARMKRSDPSLAQECQSIVSEAIAQHCPRLAVALYGSTEASEFESKNNVLTSRAFESIVDSIESTSDDPVKGIAVRNELAAQLRRARKGLKWKVPLYSRVVVGPSSDPTPLLRGLLATTDCVESLRLRWLTMYDGADGAAISHYLLLGYLLWSPPSSLADVKRHFSTIRDAERADGSDIVLLHCDVAEGETISRQHSYSLTSIPAIIASRLMEVDWSSFDWENFAAVVTTFLAIDSSGSRPSPLDGLVLVLRLLSVLRAAAIIEQPRVALYACDLKNCKAASSERRFAMLGCSHEKTQPSLSAAYREDVRARGRDRDSLEREYNLLQGILDCKDGKAKHFPLSGRLLGAQRQKKALKLAIVAELSAFAKSGVSGLVADLSGFARHLLVHGTSQREDPAFSTVETYLGSIGSRLLNAFSDVSPRDSDPEVRLEKYQKIVADLSREGASDGDTLPSATPLPQEGNAPASTLKTVESKLRVMRNLCAFDRFLTAHHGIEPTELDSLDWPDLDEALDQPIAANFVSPDEYKVTLRLLIAAVADETKINPTLRRQYRAAAVLLIILYNAGLRVSEACFLLIRDVVFIQDRLFIAVKNNFYRRMKNPLRKRLALAGANLDPKEMDILLAWRSDQVRLAEGDLKSLLFALSPTGADPFDPPLLRDILQRAFRIAANIEMWPHLLRHSAVHHQIRLAKSNIASDLWPLGMTRTECRQTSDRIGHCDFRMTVRYFHEPDRLSQWLASPPGPSPRDAFRKLGGLSLAAYDKRIVRSGAKSAQEICGALQSSAWDVRPISPAPGTPDSSHVAMLVGNLSQISLGLLERSLALAASSRADSKDTARTLGWAEQQWAQIEDCCKTIEKHQGYRLLDRRQPHRTGSEALLQRAWDSSVEHKSVRVLGEAFQTWHRGQDQRKAIGLTCTRHDAQQIRDALLALGVPQDTVFMNDISSPDRSRPVAVGLRTQPGKELPHLFLRLLAICALGCHLAT